MGERGAWTICAAGEAINGTAACSSDSSNGGAAGLVGGRVVRLALFGGAAAPLQFVFCKKSQRKEAGLIRGWCLRIEG